MATRSITKTKTRNNGNGSKPAASANKWGEVGTPGLESYSGFIEKAYIEDLYWPECYDVYNRIRRSDPEISIVRGGYQAMARKVEIEVVGPEKPNGDDTKAAEFYESELENMDGGITRWMETNNSHTPFLGWSWWWITPGLRKQDWRPPNDDPWRSEADDGLIGVRRLAWRDQSSFDHWELDDYSGRMTGLWQLDPPNPLIMLPKENSLHVTFGDPENPEGLTPLESVWRLERLKYGFEQVMGIGFEHAAGYLDVVSENSLSSNDLTHIKNAARAILTAQEGNYAAWPKGVTGEIKDVGFGAAGNLLETIRYYGLLKLQLYHMQWVAIASTAGTGAYSAMSDASSMFLVWWNAMQANFIDQYDETVGKLLWKWNSERFPKAQERPRYQAKPMNKVIDLAELGQFIGALRAAGIPLGEDDMIEIRKRSGFLSEELPEPDELVEMPKPEAPAEKEKPDKAKGAESEGEAEDDMEEDKGTKEDGGKGPKDEKELAHLARAIETAAAELHAERVAELEIDPNNDEQRKAVFAKMDEEGELRTTFGDRSSADEWGSKQKGINPNVDEDQSSALDGYKTNTYRYINEQLRTGSAEIDWTPQIERIDKVLEKTSIPEDITVYRGFPASMFPDKFKRGESIIDNGYLSTSLNSQIGEKFARWGDEFGDGQGLLKIDVPKGSRGLWMERWFTQQGESELLLPRGARLRIKSDRLRKDGVRIIRVEALYE